MKLSKQTDQILSST